MKRPPVIPTEFFGRFSRISKATWAELYRDLYLQTHGEDSPENAWIEDAEKRAEILKRAR